VSGSLSNYQSRQEICVKTLQLQELMDLTGRKEAPKAVVKAIV
jgi:hypothetical protein